MENDSPKLSKPKPPEGLFLRGGFGLSTSPFGIQKTENSLSQHPVNLLIELLFYSGLRISEALSLSRMNLLEPRGIVVQTHKKGNIREFNIPQFLWNTLYVISVGQDKIFYISYQQAYNKIKKLNFQNKFIKNKKNYSITHFFRKNLIRNMFYEYKNPVPFILDFFGWKSKKSLLYYL